MKSKSTKGLRLRKTVRGDTISDDIAQVNLVVKKQGNKALSEILGKEEKKEAKGEKKGDKKEVKAEKK